MCMREAAPRNRGPLPLSAAGHLVMPGWHHLGMGEYAIRPARPGDAASLAEVWIEFGRYYAELDPAQFQVPDTIGLEEWTKARLESERGDDLIWLVAERDGVIIGYVTAEIARPAEDAARQLLRDMGEAVLRVQALIVREPERRKGIGSALMQAVEDWARDRGATRAFLMTFGQSPSAVPFYAKMQYQGKMLGFWKEL